MKSNYRSGVRLFFSQLSILDILSGFYVLLSVLSIVLTAYGLVMWRIALPSFDLVDHHEFLAAAAKGQLDWHDLWARHNDVHLIVLPKIVFFLDMWLGRGSGLFSIVVSCTAIFLTVFLLCNVISRCCFLDKKSARFFCVLVFFTMTSDIFFESLLNPVDIQWSLLALGVVLLASGLDEWVNYGKKAWLPVVSGALIAGLSAGPLAFILSALVLAFVMTGMHAGLYRRRLAYIVLLALAGGMVWELFAWYAHSDFLLLPILMKPTTAPADWQAIAEKFLHEHPEFYVTLFYKSLAFVGDFAGVPAVSAFSSTTVSVIFFVCWFLLLLYSSRQWEKSRFFFLYLLAFSFLIAVAAGLFRVGDLYGYRHANIGFLLQLSSLVLIYSAIPEKYRKGLFAFFMVIYAGLFMRVAIAESGEWAAWGRETLRSAQIGDAIGVHDPSWFKYVWKFGDNELSSEHSRQVFRDQRVGIYASAPYRRFTGELSLPTQEVSCEYSIKSFLPVRTDSRAFLLRGITRAVTGRTMSEVLFLDAAGTHVGYGLSEMPSHDLLDQLQLAWGWGGYMLFSEKPLPALVTVIAFDNDRHCQPWNIPLPANAQRE